MSKYLDGAKIEPWIGAEGTEQESKLDLAQKQEDQWEKVVVRKKE